MRSILKWTGRVLLVLVVLLLIAAAAVYVRSNQILARTYTAPDDQIAIVHDQAAQTRGRYLVENIAVCVECHGDRFEGGVVIDDPAIGRVVAPNLTTGDGGRGGVLSDADMVRTIRYGVMSTGRSTRVMPVEDYQHLSDADLAAIIAYIRSLPAAPNEQQPTVLRPLGRILLAAGQLDIMTAERVDQSLTERGAESAVSLEYGNYLANIAGCTGCHGPGLSGGPIPGAPPDFIPAANLTPSGEVGTWSEADFIQTIRTGVNPAGHQLDTLMPWQNYRNMSDDELRAIWLFISSRAPREAGTR